MIDGKEVCEKLIEWIENKIPGYKCNNLTYAIIHYAFRCHNIPCEFTTDQANEIVLSLINRIRNKKVDGHLTIIEKAIFMCTEKSLFKHKGSASIGAGEYWTSLIMNWDFSKAKGVDLEDDNGRGVDIKAVTTSVGKIPCTFYDIDGNPIEKEHGKIKYLDRIMWRKGWSFKGMYDAIRAISFCKINYPLLDRYMFYKFNPSTNDLTYTIKTKQDVENNINSQLVHINSKKIDLTHSLWEDGAYIYTFEEFQAI